MLQLHVIPAVGRPFGHLLEGDEVVVGRSEGCHLVVADQFLSRRHLRLFRCGEEWQVEDLGSRNGTLLNGVSVGRPTRIWPGDELRLSATRIWVQHVGEEPPPEGGEQPTTGSPVFRDAAELLESHISVEPAALDDPAALRRHAERLKLLNEVHQALAGPVGLDDLLGLILDRAFDHLEPDEGVILLRQGEGDYRVAASRPAAAPGRDHAAALASRTVIRQVIEGGKVALVQDVLSDERLAGAQSIMASGMRSLLAAPLIDRQGSLGMIALSSSASISRFSEADMDLLVSLAAVAALRVRNLMLAEEAAERQRLEEELRLARAIQVRLLPTRLPEIPGWELSGGNLPSRGVSGDLYLVSERREGGEWVLLVADVSGKGMAAALLTVSLEALVSGAIELGLGAGEICASVSRRLHQRTPAAKYATAFVAVLGPASGALRYGNAGHNPALVVRASGEIDRLDATGLPLGLMPAGEYGQAESTLRPGDTLALYTDGITEAVNPDEEEYGLERLEAVLRGGRRESLEDLRAAVEAELDRFLQGVPPADDRTLVLVRRSVP